MTPTERIKEIEGALDIAEYTGQSVTSLTTESVRFLVDRAKEQDARVKRLTETLEKTLGALSPYDKNGNVSPIVELVNKTLEEK